MPRTPRLRLSLSPEEVNLLQNHLWEAAHEIGARLLHPEQMADSTVGHLVREKAKLHKLLDKIENLIDPIEMPIINE